MALEPRSPRSEKGVPFKRPYCGIMSPLRIRNVMELKPSIVEFMRCDVGNGESASFWYDAWTDFGQLLTFLGAAGPRQLRIRQDARVVEASRNGDWFLPAARSDNSQLFLAALTMAPVPHESRGQDSFLWRNAAVLLL
ncbi:unnamed protein product [Arabidopsis thaliana]|uniref:(thale cress) hypothetical protein n=1 Tax=Arabidopsis thaliana TaxID=3702 RepID=A0A7G2EVD0_ARATH|nr:unnamed protein product [Arabidopsis thaliana]